MDEFTAEEFDEKDEPPLDAPVQLFMKQWTTEASRAANQSLPAFSFFHEYPPQPHEKMLAELLDALGGGAYYHAFLRRYEPGFFRAPRLLNFVYIYLLAPWWVWRSRHPTFKTVTIRSERALDRAPNRNEC